MVSRPVASDRPLNYVLRRLGRTPRRSRHRNVQGGAARAAVLGAGDGLVTNVSLVLGIAGAASSDGSVVRLVGIAGLLAGSFSMAAGELVSVRAHAELVQHELDVESNELRTEPDEELIELAAMYEARGVPEEDARTVARILSANHDLALDTHARIELGIDPDVQPSPVLASVSSFLAFAIGAVLPLFPWFVTQGHAAVIASVAIGVVAALALGGTIGAMTGRGVARTGMRQLLALVVAAGITYGVGSLLGVGNV